MLHPRVTALDLTADEVRSHLSRLQSERTLALRTGVAGIGAYLSDLDEEIEVWRALYVGAAVTEIATRRAELFGAQVG